jgi:spore germination cell wall hydrolase CwlJ-like protein
MRYREFKLSESEQSLEAGPPYPQEDMDAVRAMQRKLEDLGYSVGSTGVDGKFGPRTTRAVRAFKQDNNISTQANILTANELSTLMSAEPVANPTTVDQQGGISDEDLGGLADINNADQAKQTVEEFLGSEITAREFEMLLRATAAEASPNAQERAAVAAVILNRVRSNGFPDTMQGVLTQRNQFQAVTGTRYDPGPSRNFTGMTASTAADVIGAFIRYLPRMDKSWLNFTSNNPRAYGRGTNINFMYAMRNAPDSQVIGQTVFGTV